MNRNLEPYFLFLAPIIIIIVLFSVPFWNRGGERSPARRPWAVGSVIFIAGGIISLTIVGLRAHWVSHFKAEPIKYLNVPDHSEKIQKE